LKQAMLYEKLEGGRVRCNLCGRRCFIPSGATGFCRVRRNEAGTLYSLVYGKLISANVDPILKKPLDFFYPGSTVFSIATVGCNFRCNYCCNWVMSQESRIIGRDFTPEQVVDLTLRFRCEGISYTYTEPTIFFEFAYDTARIAKKRGLFNTFVTNGYMTPEAVREIAPYLDAATVDFKGSGNPEMYRKLAAVSDVGPIYDCLLEMKKHGIHIEVTNLIIPKYGDFMEDVRRLAEWLRDNIGPEVPFHLLRFHPNYELVDVPYTPVKTLETAREVAMKAGLMYVLIGNVPGNRYESVYCPSCGGVLIEKYGFEIFGWHVENKKCERCGFRVSPPLQGEFKASGALYPYF